MADGVMPSREPFRGRTPAGPAGRTPADRSPRRGVPAPAAASRAFAARTCSTRPTFGSSSVYWNCVRLTRSSTVMSCTGCMNRVMPGTSASSGCKRRMTSLALDPVRSSGFRLMRMRPLFRVVLVRSMPMNDDRLSTAGSFRMIAECLLLRRPSPGKETRLAGLRDALNDARVLNREEAFRNDDEEERRSGPASTATSERQSLMAEHHVQRPVVSRRSSTSRRVRTQR